MLNAPSYLLNTLIVGISAYISAIFLLRLSGKRTLSKWNAFDFVVTIALGSILATTLVSTKTSFFQGMLAFSVLIFFQYIITWIAVRSPVVQKFIKAEPTLLLYQGKLQYSVLKQERVNEAEVFAALRSQGVASTETVEAVILETDGSFSVIKQVGNDPHSTLSALKDVKGFS